jgi:hypothetical protein
LPLSLALYHRENTTEPKYKKKYNRNKLTNENEIAHVAFIVIAWEDGGQVATVDGGVAHTEAAP